MIGSLLSILLAFLSVCEQAFSQNLELVTDGFGAGALFLLFALICAVSLLRRVGVVRSGLRPQELLVVFSMLLVASAVSAQGGVADLLPHLAGFTYFATPENGWGSRVVPLLPDGLTIKDPAVAKGFFEGVIEGREIPYRAWAGPLCAWAVLMGAFYFTSASLMVILRKRWMEQERLPFPLAQLPLMLVGGEAGERPLLRNGVFWVGFSAAALVGLSEVVHRFLAFIPTLQFYYVTRFYRNSIAVAFYLNFFVLGLSYLVSLDILGSILLFELIAYAQICLIVSSKSAILGCPPSPPYVHYTHIHQEGMGALAALVAGGIYEARHHLRDVLGKALGVAPHVDDSREMLSYRAAVVGAATGVGFICWWLWMTGIPAWVVPIFVGIALMAFLGITRILAEAGVVMSTPLTPMHVLLHSAGTRMLGGGAVAGFFLAQPWAFPLGSHGMASASTSLRLTHRGGLRSRSLFRTLSLALILGGGTAAVSLLHYVYTLGAYGFSNSNYVVSALNYQLNYYGSAITSPSEGQPVRLLWSGVGALAMGLLMLARQRFYWWPIHPIGYPISAIPWGWSSVFVAWLIKRNVLKYGGPSLYGQTRPFFLGLILGQAVIASVGSLVAILTGRV